MESAPLTLAHTHARNAAIETNRSNAVAASEEHDLAAAEFAAAAQTTSDSEALRILNLLEQHHKKLGQILKSRHEKPQAAEVATVNPTVSIPQADKTADPAKQESSSASAETTVQPPRLSKAVRPNARDLSSSIASNLASARGIPSHRQRRSIPISPLVSNQHADGQFTQDESGRKAGGSQGSEAREASPTTQNPQPRPSWAPPLNPSEDVTEAAKGPTADAPFQQFYNTFESLISKLSAPLAFAGLPLTATPTSKPEIAQAHQGSKTAQTPKPSEPTQSVDYSQLISRAALRAVHSNASGGTSHNPSESFYVVPTTGGTISYAEIMNHADREESRTLRGHQRQISNLSNISEDDFVDAPSTFLVQQDRTTRARRGADEVKVKGKTMEELSLENEALKHLSDTLSKRLHVFEMSAQTSSAALAQSIRSLQRSPLATPEHSRGKGSHKGIVAAFAGNSDGLATEGMAKRITELEEILRKSDAKARKKDEENVKLKEMIVKYREKWESLKAGAKARREREGHGPGQHKSPRKGGDGGGGEGSTTTATATTTLS